MSWELLSSRVTLVGESLTPDEEEVEQESCRSCILGTEVGIGSEIAVYRNVIVHPKRVLKVSDPYPPAAHAIFKVKLMSQLITAQVNVVAHRITAIQCFSIFENIRCLGVCPLNSRFEQPK